MENLQTCKTAIVLIPPEPVWEPIQAIRRAYDRKIRRWMPHITLLYPFRPREAFDTVAPAIAEVCRDIAPVQLEFESFNFFCHRRNHYTLWLAPEPEHNLVQLHEAIWRIVPDCKAIRRFPNGFMPHLSVGQVTGKKRLQEVLERLQAHWRPVTFTTNQISLIWREDPPNDVFRVDRVIKLGNQ